jgi:hypothetical protein
LIEKKKEEINKFVNSKFTFKPKIEKFKSHHRSKSHYLQNSNDFNLEM